MGGACDARHLDYTMFPLYVTSDIVGQGGGPVRYQGGPMPYRTASIKSQMYLNL